MVGPCDFSVSPSPFGLGPLDFGTSDSGLTIIYKYGPVKETKYLNTLAP